MNSTTGITQDSNPGPTLSTREVKGGAPGRAGRGCGRERGSLLILCVTVLIIIALIGIAFLQRVRMDQFAIARHERSYINLAINGILGEVSNQLETDVNANQTGGQLLYDYPWTDHNKKEFVATLEYPLPAGSPPTTIKVNGYRQIKVGTNPPPPPLDDRWLASTAPVWNFNDNEYRWLHLTNLTGIWLEMPDPLAGGAFSRPIERPIVASSSQMGRGLNSDTDLVLNNDTTDTDSLAFTQPGFEPRGVDADGDGIKDSRWQWAPVSVRNLGGRKFVMALRIIDLNSMLNINTATSMTFTGSAGAPLVARGYNPSWVDLSRLFSRMTPSLVSTANWKDELTQLIQLRVDPTPLTMTDFDIVGASIFERTAEMRTMWEQQGSIYGNSDRNYLMNSEMELRRFGGLNDRSLSSPLEIQMGKTYAAGSRFSRMLRQHPLISNDAGIIGPEGSFLDVVDPGNALSLEQAISRWFYGDNGGAPGNDGDSLAVKIREFPAIRHMLTTASGAGVYAPTPNAATSASSRFKFDLHRDWTGGSPGDSDLKMNNLRNQLEPVFKRSRANLGGKYLGLNDSQVNELIAEYVVAIKDYSDPDTEPTLRVTPGGVNTYGLERLPFLREVYVQALYADKNLLDVNGVDSTDPMFVPGDVNFDTWEYDPLVTGGDTRAMVIELGNPFSHKILGVDPNLTDGVVQGLENQVEIKVFQGATQIGAWTFDATTPDIDARDDAGGGDDDTLIIYSPPMNPLDEALNTGVPNDGSDLPGDLNFPATAKWLRLPPGTLTSLGAGFDPSSAGAIAVELWVMTSSGSRRMYDRIELNAAASLPAKVDHQGSPKPVAEHQFAQASSARDCDKIKYVVDDGPSSTDFRQNLPSTSGAAYSATVDRFGNDAKGFALATYAADPTFFERLQLPLPDEPMTSLAELGWVHMFGFTDTQTFSERMSAKSGGVGLPANEHFLLVDPKDPEYDVVTTFGIPHAALLMDLFSTVSPRDDKRDNDNDDGDNDPLTSATATPPDKPSIDNREEIFVPGKINVNTAPMHLMTLGSPMGENLDDAEKLMRTIVAYRDEPLRGSRLRLANNHGPYWSVGTAGFDVDRVRDNMLNPNHLKDFPGSPNKPGGRLDQPGIASLGELLYLNPGTPANDMLRYGLDGSNALPGGNGGMDMYPDPNDNTANGPKLNQGDDNEQLLARFGMLSQAYTVRSDRFVVYGVVRGYLNDSFNQLPVETARFIAVIDRGSMGTPGTDSPRVIGFVRLQ